MRELALTILAKFPPFPSNFYIFDIVLTLLSFLRFAEFPQFNIINRREKVSNMSQQFLMNFLWIVWTVISY